jgi:hypothetical protein
MNRKGLRPGIKLAIDRPEAGTDFRKVLPFRRSWPAIGILAAFDAAFMVPAVFVFQDAIGSWGRLDDLFDLVGALFSSAWLLGWSIAPLVMTCILALMLFGREVIRARTGRVEIFFGLPIIGVAAEYDVSRMRNLRYDQPPKKSGKAWRGSNMMFDYGANTVAVGSDISGHDFTELKHHIEAATGQKVRRGEATDEELKGEWQPSARSIEETASEPAAFDPVVPAKPVTLASFSTLALIIANLVPLAGAALLGWNLGDVMVLYWAESAIIGIFNACKIIVIGRWSALLAAPFFLGHFGGFMSVHFLFIYSIFVKSPQDMSGTNLAEVALLFTALWPALAVLFVSHAFSFFKNFVGRKEYRYRTVKSQMSDPYSRIIFMHLVLIFGGGLTMILGETTPVLMIVIVLKIWMDVKAHINQHAVKESTT